jgi:plastocyanin
LNGKSPGNLVIRMGVDPKCAQLNAGKQVVQEAVVTSNDGGLANVFVKLQGSFPQTPVPAEPVVIDQRGCIYRPRVLGIRAGQTLQIRNSDALSHNVHSVSSINAFNVGQGNAGAISSFKLKDEPDMVQLKCDIHRWMTAYVGVVNHPYFAVTGEAGSFVIEKVPAGTHTIQTWHERYGVRTQTVRVTAGTITTVDFTYP